MVGLGGEGTSRGVEATAWAKLRAGIGKVVIAKATGVWRGARRCSSVLTTGGKAEEEGGGTEECWGGVDSALGELPRILLASGPRRHRQQARPSGPGRWKRWAFDVIEGGSWPVALGRPGGAPRLPITRRGGQRC